MPQQSEGKGGRSSSPFVLPGSPTLPTCEETVWCPPLGSAVEGEAGHEA